MKKYLNRKLFTASFLVLFLVVQFYSLTEYSFAAFVTDEVIVTLTVDSGITISHPADVVMTTNLTGTGSNMGVSVNGVIGTAVWTVITNHASGYSLAVHDSTDPAMASGSNSFANYTEAIPSTPEQPWTVASGDKEFGFSAYGTDTNTGTWGVAASCGSAGAPSTTQKYMGFLATPTDKLIATRATVTPTTGIATTICFAAEQNGIFAASGVYTATITATATEI